MVATPSYTPLTRRTEADACGTGSLVRLEGFGAAYAERIVLADVSLEIPKRGMTCIVGPSGAGKSTLVRALAGSSYAHPEFRTWGLESFDLALGASETCRASAGQTRRGVGFVVQHARFFIDTVRENLAGALPNRSRLDRASQARIFETLHAELELPPLGERLDADVASLPTATQRQVAIVRALVADPALVLVDEPTSGLEEHDALEIAALLRRVAETRSIVVVTHDQRVARALGGTTVLLAGGRSVEVASTSAFFEAPSSEHGRQFVRTGGCLAPGPMATEEDLEPAFAPRAHVVPNPVKSRHDGPRGFFWVRPGRLGGLPRPGIVAELEQDIAGLKRLDVSVLVTLEETRTVDPSALEAAGIESVHFPIEDMRAPSVVETRALCELITRRIAQDGVVAVHCRAGLGRTGTILASHLVSEGMSACDAIERVRFLCPKAIQSGEQVDFLSALEAEVREDRRRDA